MLQSIFVGIIIGLVVAYVWQRRQAPAQHEGFTSDLTPTNRVGEPDDDPLDLPWIASWSPLDAEARRGHFCTVISEIAGPDDTRLQIVHPSCEEGMAHTRAGDRIVIPQSIPDAVRQETIDHERVHIAQRRNPELWRHFYEQQWRFTFHAEPPPGLPVTIRTARRGNPDTWDPDTGGPWPCWSGRWWPVPIYRSTQSPRLREATTIWYDANTGKTLTEPPEVWTAFFGTPSQPEHPHELAAVLLIADDRATEAGRRLWTWWQTHQMFSLDREHPACSSN